MWPLLPSSIAYCVLPNMTTHSTINSSVNSSSTLKAAHPSGGVLHKHNPFGRLLCSSAPGVAITDKPAILRAVADPATLDRLARVEHRRWMTDRIEQGWRHGETRDNNRLIHPSICDFDALSADDKEKDRNAVRKLAEIAAG